MTDLSDPAHLHLYIAAELKRGQTPPTRLLREFCRPAVFAVSLVGENRRVTVKILPETQLGGSHIGENLHDPPRTSF